MTAVDVVGTDQHLEEVLACRSERLIPVQTHAIDAVLFGDVPAWISAEMRRRAARALIMPDPTDDRPMLVLLANEPRARDNGVYVVGDDGQLVRHRSREKPAPWWRGAVAAASVPVE